MSRSEPRTLLAPERGEPVPLPPAAAPRARPGAALGGGVAALPPPGRSPFQLCAGGGRSRCWDGRDRTKTWFRDFFSR